MNRHAVLPILAFCYATVSLTAQTPAPAPLSGKAEALSWKFNDRDRPLPPVVAPKPESDLAEAAKPPAGATVLFDGKDLSQWNPSKWKVENGVVETVPKSGWLVTREPFGSCRLHLEWQTSDQPPFKDGQNRGNSGVFLMGDYEVQVLDTHENKTYADGMAGAVYGQYPPSVNPIRPPGQWQYYDIEFHRPVFDAAGTLTRPARITVDFNGVRVQDNAEVLGPTNPPGRRPYKAHADKLPLKLQDHNEIVRYRNIWIQPIAD